MALVQAFGLEGILPGVKLPEDPGDRAVVAAALFVPNTLLWGLYGFLGGLAIDKRWWPSAGVSAGAVMAAAALAEASVWPLLGLETGQFRWTTWMNLLRVAGWGAGLYLCPSAEAVFGAVVPGTTPLWRRPVPVLAAAAGLLLAYQVTLSVAEMNTPSASGILPGSWRALTPAGAGCRVLMPGTPEGKTAAEGAQGPEGGRPGPCRGPADAGDAPRPAAPAGGIDLKDIAAAKGLVERVGPARLRELIDLPAR